MADLNGQCKEVTEFLAQNFFQHHNTASDVAKFFVVKAEALKQHHPKAISPPADVDVVWQNMLLETELYAALCELLGVFVHYSKRISNDAPYFVEKRRKEYESLRKELLHPNMRSAEEQDSSASETSPQETPGGMAGRGEAGVVKRGWGSDMVESSGGVPKAAKLSSSTVDTPASPFAASASPVATLSALMPAATTPPSAALSKGAVPAAANPESNAPHPTEPEQAHVLPKDAVSQKVRVPKCSGCGETETHQRRSSHLCPHYKPRRTSAAKNVKCEPSSPS